MTSGKTALFGLILTLAILDAAAACAQGPDDGDEEGYGIGVGLLGMTGKTPYGFTKTAVLPMVDYDGTYLRVSGPAADLKLPWISNERLSFALRANLFTGEGYKPSDAPILTGMARRKEGIWLGGVADWSADLVDLSFEALADVGDSEGLRLKAEASRMFFLGERVALKPRAGLVWMDDKAVDHFYGVRAEEVRTGRPAYEGSSAVALEAGLTLSYMLAPRHMLMLDLGVASLGSGVTDSPIVVEDTLYSVGAGYMFRF